MSISLLFLLPFIACQTTSTEQEKEGFILQDADADGYLENEDCDDSNPAVSPEADELCDGIDNNCNGQVDEDVKNTFYADSDGDGFGSMEVYVEACAPSIGFVDNGSDCDDGDAAAYPGAEELCDAVDNNCDGEVDEGQTLTFYVDNDGDGVGDANSPVEGCDLTLGLSTLSGDCDDQDANISPLVDEICDGFDNNCDGSVDEGVGAVFYRDADEDGYGDPALSEQGCTSPQGYVEQAGDCDDSEVFAYPGAIEVCDGIDNNCDGTADEAGAVGEVTSYADADGDGFGDDTSMLTSCSVASGRVLQGGDCDDNVATANPAMVEICDGVDNNCDGQADEAGAVGEITSYADADSDGFGDDTSMLTSCALASGRVLQGGDCDDNVATANPAMVEICDSIDNNCDGSADEAGAVGEVTSYADADGDGFGDDTSMLTSCAVASGRVLQGDDCDDNDPAVSPGMVELCDELDNNCDGVADEGLQATYYLDSDGDGYGIDSDTLFECEQPQGYSAQAGDCDDDDITVNPAASEVGYDGVDNDCDASTVDGESDLLLHMDGVSDQFVDSSGNNWQVTAVGGMQHSTAESKFGGTSGYFDGSDDRLEVEDVDWSFGLDDFTIDMWVWVDHLYDMGLATTESPITAVEGWMFDIDMHGGSGSHGLRFKVGSTVVVEGPGGSGASYPTQTWYHVAVVRSNGVFTLYKDGVSVATAATTVSIDDSPYVLRVGHRGTTADWFHGFIDEVRIVRGTALWTGDFTPPTAPTLGAGD